MDKESVVLSIEQFRKEVLHGKEIGPLRAWPLRLGATKLWACLARLSSRRSSLIGATLSAQASVVFSAGTCSGSTLCPGGAFDVDVIIYTGVYSTHPRPFAAFCDHLVILLYSSY